MQHFPRVSLHNDHLVSVDRSEIIYCSGQMRGVRPCCHFSHGPHSRDTCHSSSRALHMILFWSVDYHNIHFFVENKEGKKSCNTRYELGVGDAVPLLIFIRWSGIETQALPSHETLYGFYPCGYGLTGRLPKKAFKHWWQTTYDAPVIQLN